MQETLDTLDKVLGLAKSLSSDPTDKKSISDAALGLKKVLPYARESLPPVFAELCSALSLLFEKFLMETPSNGQEGIDLARQGIEKIIKAVKSKRISAKLTEDTEKIVSELTKKYSFATPENAAVDEESDDDSFFAEMKDDSYQAMRDEKLRTDTDDEPEEHVNPLVEKLDAISGAFTLLEPDLMDKKAVSDIMVGFEEIGSGLMGDGAPVMVTKLAMTLGAIYEKSLMEGVSNGQMALDLTSQGIKILSLHFENFDASDDVALLAGPVIESIENDLAVPAPEVPGAEKNASTQPNPDVAADVKPENEKSLEVTKAGVELIKVASADDLLIYDEFAHEASDTVHSLEGDLLSLESDPADEDLINTLFRAFHSLKGAAGFLGVSTVNVICHEAETLLDKLRKKKFLCSQAMVDAFLASVDVIRTVNDELTDQCHLIKSQMPNATLEIPRLNIDGLVEVLSSFSESPDVAKSEIVAEGDAPRIGEILLDNNLITENQLDAALKSQKFLGEALVEMGAVDKKSVASALEAQALKKRKAGASSLKVDTEKLDSLLELVGELVISQSIVLQDSVLNEEVNMGLAKNLLNLGKVSKNIQDQVMSLRMIPLRQTFQKMSRLVRDLSKKMNKEVLFQLSGEDTEIDKALIEELNDPLVHLLRNAMDHGVESPDERVKAGKRAEGLVKLSAYHRGGNVHIKITDDGKGLDRDHLVAKAIDKGLIAPDAELSEQEAYNLIFLPGFSTHDVATDISGRGVGMDVVRSNIDKLGGKVEIQSTPGEGSAFTIKLPLTMAIVDGMIVRVGDNRFIIPTISIRESIRPKMEEISTVKHEGELLNVRGRLLPLFRLHNILEVENSVHMNPWEGLVIVVESDDKDYGLLVDDLLGQQQVVIKSLGKRFAGLPGISGGTILGDGQVGLILDIGGIVCMN